MSATLTAAQIPASCLKATLERADFLIEDLKTLRGLLEHAEAVPAPLADSIESRLLQILDEMSPELRHARDKAQRYAETPKLGEPFFSIGTGGRL